MLAGRGSSIAADDLLVLIAQEYKQQPVLPSFAKRWIAEPNLEQEVPRIVRPIYLGFGVGCSADMRFGH